MTLSKRTEYGVRAVIQLARMGAGQYVQSKDLASHEELPTKFLESILLTLRRSGFLESKVGSGGGYRLSRPASEINVGRLVRELEGRLSDKEPAVQRQTPGGVAVDSINQRLTEAMDDVLDNLTLESLLEQVLRETSDEQNMYYI